MQRRRIDFNAPIKPGESAAGLKLGLQLHEIDPAELSSLQYQVQSFHHAPTVKPWHIYSSENIYLRFEEEVLTTIGVMGRYTGKIYGTLGIGKIVADFELLLGKLIEGDEDELTFELVQGSLWFQVDDTDASQDNWRTTILSRSVQELYIRRK